MKYFSRPRPKSGGKKRTTRRTTQDLIPAARRRLLQMMQWDVPEQSSSPKATATKARKTTKKRAPAKKPRDRQLTVPLTRSIRLVLTVKHVRPSAKKRRPASAKARPAFLGRFNQQVMTAVAIVLLGLSGILYFGWKAVLASPAPPATPTSLHAEENVLKDVLAPATKSARHYPRSTPTSISIPDIDVSTTISAIGNNPDGSMVVPADWHTAGWYQYSPTPGEIGPAILDGHLDNVSGIAVFWRLRELTPGEFIYIMRQDGTTVQFRVDSVQNYSQSDFPTKQVYGNIDYAGLRLITCGGTFNRLTHHYDQNTVVYATLVN